MATQPINTIIKSECLICKRFQINFAHTKPSGEENKIGEHERRAAAAVCLIEVK